MSTTSDSVGPRIDFKAAFEALPGPYMILDPAFRYVEVNAAYCAVTARTRDELIGECLFDLFPNSGPEGLRLRQSFERVLVTGQPEAIALIPYPISGRDGTMEMRYWSAAHAPLFDDDGCPVYVMQNTVDVTELQRLKTIAFGPNAEPLQGEKDILLRAQQVDKVNRALSEETQGLRDLFLQAPGFMAVLAGPELTFTIANESYQQLIGHRRIVGRPLVEALPEIVGQGFVELLREVVATGRPYVGEAVSVMLQRSPGAPLEERILDFIYQPIVSRSGEQWGVFVQGSDVSDRVHAQRQQKLLLDELNHRVKNTLATVQAIARQTLRSTPEPTAFRDAFEARLMALSATHNLLTATSWRSAGLKDLVAAELQPYGAARFNIQGPTVLLSPPQAVALGLVLHELTTNAAKYGALSDVGGEVDVRWTVVEDEGASRLDLEWIERGGPSVAPPQRRGFGSRLVETSLASLHGDARINFAPEGLRCVITLPLKEAGGE